MVGGSNAWSRPALFTEAKSCEVKCLLKLLLERCHPLHKGTGPSPAVTLAELLFPAGTRLHVLRALIESLQKSTFFFFLGIQRS